MRSGRPVPAGAIVTGLVSVVVRSSGASPEVPRSSVSVTWTVAVPAALGLNVALGPLAVLGVPGNCQANATPGRPRSGRWR